MGAIFDVPDTQKIINSINKNINQSQKNYKQQNKPENSQKQTFRKPPSGGPKNAKNRPSPERPKNGSFGHVFIDREGNRKLIYYPCNKIIYTEDRK